MGVCEWLGVGIDFFVYMCVLFWMGVGYNGVVGVFYVGCGGEFFNFSFLIEYVLINRFWCGGYCICCGYLYIYWECCMIFWMYLVFVILVVILIFGIIKVLWLMSIIFWVFIVVLFIGVVILLGLLRLGLLFFEVVRWVIFGLFLVWLGY